MSDVVTIKPSSRRINFRIIIFGVVVALLVGYPMYIYLDSELSGGIKAAGNLTEVDLKAMSTFSFDQVNGRLEDVPEKWRDLDGKKVILYGEIAPTGFSARGANEFDLCYSVAKCCFSGPPQVQHFVKSRVGKQIEIPGFARLVKVTGVLHVDVKKSEGQINSIYQLDVQSVEEM